MIRYYVLDDSGEAVEATEEVSHLWMCERISSDFNPGVLVEEFDNPGCGCAMLWFTGVHDEDAGTEPFLVSFRYKNRMSFSQWKSHEGFAYFRHRADAIAHAQKLTEKVGAAWNGILDIIQQELPSKA